MIFFVRHYLHRRKVHTISVKATNTLSHQRHQQGQRRASHQSVCPFVFFFSSPVFSVQAVQARFCFSRVLFALASPHLFLYCIFILLFPFVECARFNVLNRNFSFVFIGHIVFTQDMRVVQIDQRSVGHRSW